MYNRVNICIHTQDFHLSEGKHYIKLMESTSHYYYFRWNMCCDIANQHFNS